MRFVLSIYPIASRLSVCTTLLILVASQYHLISPLENSVEYSSSSSKTVRRYGLFLQDRQFLGTTLLFLVNSILFLKRKRINQHDFTFYVYVLRSTFYVLRSTFCVFIDFPSDSIIATRSRFSASSSTSTFILLLISSFISLYFSNSCRIKQYSSSEIPPSSKAFEMYSLMVLSFASTNVLIFSCFPAFTASVLLARLPIKRRITATTAIPSIAITTGAATIVERTPIPEIASPIVATPRTTSIPLFLFTLLLYFILSADLFSRSLSSCV